MDSLSPEYSVIVPVFNSDQTVLELVERLERVFRDALSSTYEIILIDDGSNNPKSWATCKAEAQRSPQVTAVRLFRNYAKPSAILCGLNHARGAYIITIDDDLQQHPEDIPKLVAYRDHDVVVANFYSRKDNLIKRMMSWFKGHFDRTILQLPCKMSPLKLFSAEVARGMIQISTSHPFIPALLSHVTLDFIPVVVEHSASRHGKSRYTLRKSFRQLSNLVISNSALLLHVMGGIGAAVALSGFGLALHVLYRKIIGSVPLLKGWASLMVVNLVFGGLVLLALGIIGEYLIRILEGTSNKPPYLIREIVSHRDELAPTSNKSISTNAGKAKNVESTPHQDLHS